LLGQAGDAVSQLIGGDDDPVDIAIYIHASQPAPIPSLNLVCSNRLGR
jgi:hypothetical protein